MEDLKVTRLGTYSGTEPLPEHSPDAHEATIQDEKDRRFGIFLKYLPGKLENEDVSFEDAATFLASRKKEILDSCKTWEQVDDAMDRALQSLLSGDVVNEAATQEKPVPKDDWDNAFQSEEPAPWKKAM